MSSFIILFISSFLFLRKLSNYAFTHDFISVSYVNSTCALAHVPTQFLTHSITQVPAQTPARDAV